MKNYWKNQQHRHMKKDRISDEPSESNLPLNQTTDSFHQNPFPNMEKPPALISHVLLQPARRPVRTLRQVEPLHFATCHGLTGRTANHQQMWRSDTWPCQVEDRGHSGDKTSSQSAPQGKRTPVHTDTGEGAHDGHGHPNGTRAHDGHWHTNGTRDLCDRRVLIPALDGERHQSWTRTLQVQHYTYTCQHRQDCSHILDFFPK